MRRLFVDPASYSTGWALFEGDELKDHGSIIISKKEKDVFVRMRDMYLEYFQLGEELRPLDEIYIEKFKPFATDNGMKLVGSVYVIGAALGCYGPIKRIWTQHWQKPVGYKKGEAPTGLLWPYRNKVVTEDELAAIGMGLWFTQCREDEDESE